MPASFLESDKMAFSMPNQGNPPFIVAEVSGNHNGDLSRALRIIDAVADAGADAVKFQTYTANTITIDSDQPRFRISAGHPLWGGRTLHELYTEAHTPWEWHATLFRHARDCGLVPFSSPFDRGAVDLLEKLEAPLYKIASLEIGDLQLLKAVAQTGKPVILSNGAASLSDLDLAVRTIRAEGNSDIAILCCTSSYPADPSESNLRGIPVLADMFGVATGLSDHTMGIGAAIAAVALGASIIEKHVTLDRSEGGVDAEFSLEPHELKQLVIESRRAWASLGSPTFVPTDGESESLKLRRSLCVVEDVREGDEVTVMNVRSIRPAGGLEPRYLDSVMGRRFRQDVAKGTALTWDVI